MQEVKNWYAGTHFYLVIVMIYLGTSLVWRKSKISMQEDREVQGKSTIRIIPNIVDYYFLSVLFCFMAGITGGSKSS